MIPKRNGSFFKKSNMFIVSFWCTLLVYYISQKTSLSVFSLFLLAFILFPINDAYSFKIHSADNIDLTEYPLCNYEEQWNESERFNELVVDELKIRTNDMNNEPENFDKIYSDVLNYVNRENPGLYEQGIQIKNWINEQLVL